MNMPHYISITDRLIGLYWYCYSWHSGQDSWQYRYLSNAHYKPGPLESCHEMEEGPYEAYQHYYEQYEEGNL